jgi:hypothetical protein
MAYTQPGWSPFTKKKDGKKKKKTSSDPFAGDYSNEVGPKKPLLEPLPRIRVEQPRPLDLDKYYGRTHDVVENKSDPFAGTRKSYVPKAEYRPRTGKLSAMEPAMPRTPQSLRLAPPGHYFHTDESDPFAGKRVKLKKRHVMSGEFKPQKVKKVKKKVKSKKKSNPFG